MSTACTTRKPYEEDLIGEAEGGELPPAPRDAGALRQWLSRVLNLRIETGPGGRGAPFAYLRHAFLGDLPGAEYAAVPDCIVWANRGGGKTYLGAVATALDLLYKDGIEIRILAGSVEQAQKMHRYLREIFEVPALRARVDGRMTDRRLVLRNRSRVEILASSQTSVRGNRVQKVRCDEVELFKAEMWEAAQLTTRSKQCGEFLVRGAVECLSTMHMPHGLMSRLVLEAREDKRALFRWGVLDVMERCPQERLCCAAEAEGTNGREKRRIENGGMGEAEGRLVALPQLAQAGEGGGCPLWVDCRGTAKQFEGGHLRVEDALVQMSRVSRRVWEAEMLCLRPQRTACVFEEFDPAVHVTSLEPDMAGGIWLCGMDFGFRAPTVVLWTVLDRRGCLHVVDERVLSGVLVQEHIRALAESPWPRPEWIGADPAGRTENDQTGQSAVRLLERAGFRPLTKPSRVQTGIAMIAARLKPADGSSPRLLIHERCRHLIESMEKYHYDPTRPQSSEPVKDGSDHAIDALRYLLVNLERGEFGQRSYLGG